MSEIKLYRKRLYDFILFIIALPCLIGGAWLWYAQSQPLWLGYTLTSVGAAWTLIMLWRMVHRRPRISLTVHGIQFHYPTERSDGLVEKTPLFNQFVAWDDIQAVQCHRHTLQLHIDDNPPDYERLNEIELANLPPREIVLYQLTAAVGALNVSAEKLAAWLSKMHQAEAKDRSALLLSFYYEK